MPENNNATIIRNLKFPTGTYEIGLGSTDSQELQDTFQDIDDNFDTLNQAIEDNELTTAAALNELNDLIQALPSAPEDFGFGYGTCATAAATAAKTATLTDYVLTKGGIVAIKFTNDVPANATLSINEETATAMYYNGVAITANIIYAGDTAVFMYDGTYYHLLCVDRGINITCGDY